MRKSAFLTLAILLAVTPAAWAQTSMQPGTGSAAPPGQWHGTHARKRAVRAAERAGEHPLDHGPFTPQANGAYQGGGMVLQGAPGGPPPMPQPTAPGQMPQNAVPVR